MPSNPASEQVSKNPAHNQAAVAPDELLPPVEAPSGGFILQLFVFPAVIVFAVVMLGFLMTSMASQGDQDPTKIVAALRGSNHTRWQKAEELANMLRLEKRYPKLKYNSELASELAKLLDEEVTAGLDEKNSINLRYYLSRVLGEFYVTDGVEVLLKTAREDKERDVRREAISALAVLSNALGELEEAVILKHPELVETFVALANDKDDLIRSQTAFALGVITSSPQADDKLTRELELLVDDLYSDARYNAALSLARQGNLKALNAIAEMFDIEALDMSTAKEKSDSLKSFKRDTMVKNALKAGKQLVEKNPATDLAELKNAVEKFVSSGPQWQPAPAPKSLVKLGQELLAILVAK